MLATPEPLERSLSPQNAEPARKCSGKNTFWSRQMWTSRNYGGCTDRSRYRNLGRVAR